MAASVHEDMTSSARSWRDVFVGREREMATLNRAIRDAQSGRGRLLLIAGEPGIGKTRLAAEFATAARHDGAVVLWGGCYDGEWAPPFGPFAEAITAYARRCAPDALRADLGFGAAPVARVIPAVRERLPDLSEPTPLQPDEERFRLLDAVSQFLIAVAQRMPVLLVLDDLHWADKGSIAMLRHVARFAPQHRLLLLGTYRDVDLDTQHPLTDALGALYRETACERLLLKGLDALDVVQLVVDSEVAAERQDSVATEITAITNGNPFFVREVLRHLAAEGAVGRNADRKVAIPDSVRQVLARRVRRLPAESGRLLSVAAAFGGPFHLGVAARVAGLDDAAALNAIDEALRAQLVRPADAAERYGFTHALIRETLYSELSPSRQARLHRQLAEAMEHVYGDCVAEHAAEIAHLYHRSREIKGAERGVDHALAASERAAAAYARDEVVSLLRVALDLLPASDARRPRVCGRLGIALAQVLSLDEAQKVASEAAQQIASSESEAAAADYLADVVSAMSGFSHSACAIAQEGLRYIGSRRDATFAVLMMVEIIRRETEAANNPGIPLDSAERREVARIFAELAGDPEHADRWLPYSQRADFAFGTKDELREHGLINCYGEYRLNLSRLREHVVQCEQQGRLAEAVSCWGHTFSCHTALGDFEAAQTARARAIALARRLPGPSNPTALLIGAEDQWRMAVDEGWDKPLEDLGPGLGQGRVLAHYRAATQAAIARTHARMVRHDRALRRLESVLPAIERAPFWAENYIQIACDAAETLWLSGRTDHIDIIEQGVRQKVIAPNWHSPMTDGRLALARLCALQRRYEEAVEWFAKSRAVLDEQGARPLRAIVDYDEGLMYVRRGAGGDRERARPLLRAALAQFRALGMPGWIRRAESLLHHGKEWTLATQAAEQPPSFDSAEDRPLDAAQDTPGPLEGDFARPETKDRKPRARDQQQETNLFRQEGQFWTVAYAGKVVRLKDGKGVQYIAHLLRHPGHEVLAFDMISNLSAEPQSSATIASARLNGDDLGPLLDAQAKRAYRERVRDLREELDEATHNNDLGRAAALQAEIELLAEQLRSAVGLGGKDRTSGGVSERARLTVTKRIKAILKELDTLHPQLAHHLRACVKTGRICTYVPPPGQPMDWQL